MKESCGKAKDQQRETNAEIASRLQFVRHKLLVLSGKGGVGKSMVSAQLAFALARRGYYVGLLDVDICGPTVPKMLGARGRGVNREEGGLEPVRVSDHIVAMSIGFIMEDDTEAVIWRGPRKLGLIQMFLKDVNWGILDFLIVDTPPGTSDEHISIVQLLVKGSGIGVDGAVVVTSPQDVSVVEVGKEINFCERMGVPVLGVVENFASFACPLCSAVTDVWPATSGGGLRLAADHHVPFLGRVPLDPMLARAGESGIPLAVAETPTSKALESITDQIVATVGTLAPHPPHDH
jgi:Mrp family chromosome partitioning ATPase